MAADRMMGWLRVTRQPQRRVPGLHVRASTDKSLSISPPNVPVLRGSAAGGGDSLYTGAVTYGSEEIVTRKGRGAFSYETPVNYAIPVHELTRTPHKTGYAKFLHIAATEQSAGLLDEAGRNIHNRILTALNDVDNMAFVTGGHVNTKWGPFSRMMGIANRQSWVTSMLKTKAAARAPGARLNTRGMLMDRSAQAWGGTPANRAVHGSYSGKSFHTGASTGPGKYLDGLTALLQFHGNKGKTSASITRRGG